MGALASAGRRLAVEWPSLLAALASGTHAVLTDAASTRNATTTRIYTTCEESEGNSGDNFTTSISMFGGGGGGGAIFEESHWDISRMAFGSGSWRFKLIDQTESDSKHKRE